MLSSIKKNILANYIGRIWGFVSTFIFVPFYLKILGVEAYAIIQFYAVLLGVMAFADAGLTITLTREFARTDKDDNYKANLLRTFECCYLIILAFIAIVIIGCSNFIAEKWLNVEHIKATDAAGYIKIIGFCIALQMMSTLYQGGLLGLQKQVFSNILSISWNLCRTGLVLIPLYFYPSLKLFFIWQSVVNLAYLLVLKKSISYLLFPTYKPNFQKQLLFQIGHFALGIMGMAILSSILIQSDKLVVSKVLSLTEFGIYTLASTFGIVPLMITTPIAVAVFPKLTELVTNQNMKKKEELFNIFSFIITSISVTAILILLGYTRNYLSIWTHKPEIAGEASFVAQIICIGIFFQALQLMPYYLGLSQGHTKTNILIGIFSNIFMIPTLFIAAHNWGLRGAPVPFLIMSIVTFFVLSSIIVHKFMLQSYFFWLSKYILLPILTSMVVFIPLYTFFNILPQGIFTILYGCICGITMLVVCAVVLQRLYPEIKLLSIKTIFE